MKVSIKDEQIDKLESKIEYLEEKIDCLQEGKELDEYDNRRLQDKVKYLEGENDRMRTLTGRV